jgi:hypothetical protein
MQVSAVRGRALRSRVRRVRILPGAPADSSATGPAEPAVPPRWARGQVPLRPAVLVLALALGDLAAHITPLTCSVAGVPDSAPH